MYFKSLSEAIRLGFSIYDRRKDGTILLRIMTPNGWAMAFCKDPDEPK